LNTEIPNTRRLSMKDKLLKAGDVVAGVILTCVMYAYAIMFMAM